MKEGLGGKDYFACLKIVEVGYFSISFHFTGILNYFRVICISRYTVIVECVEHARQEQTAAVWAKKNQTLMFFCEMTHFVNPADLRTSYVEMLCTLFFLKSKGFFHICFNNLTYFHVLLYYNIDLIIINTKFSLCDSMHPRQQSSPLDCPLCSVSCWTDNTVLLNGMTMSKSFYPINSE